MLQGIAFSANSNKEKIPKSARHDGVRHYPLSNANQESCGKCGKRAIFIWSKYKNFFHFDCYESSTKFNFITYSDMIIFHVNCCN